MQTKIIADSIAPNGKRITTFELEYPRFIHSEFMTHRAISKNSASSRAIPVAMMLKTIRTNPVIPLHWGKNKPGMKADSELENIHKFGAKLIWKFTGRIVCYSAWLLMKIGLHKQIVNRMVEPWSHIKIVATATEWDNFFYLRCHPDAQPEIRQLANKMHESYIKSKPTLLEIGEWHLPYVSNNDKNKYELGDTLKLSASLCAQISYRKSDEALSKALKIYKALVESKPVHSSPFEHQATPAPRAEDSSGNFKGWIQNRQLLKDNVCTKYIKV